MRQRDEERLIAGLRAVSENAREFEEICRLSSAKDSFEGLVNAYVEIECARLCAANMIFRWTFAGTSCHLRGRFPSPAH